MTGNVHLGQPSINDVGAAFKQVVEHPTHIFFVALDGAAGDDDRVAGMHFYVTVFAVGHAV